MLVEAGQRLVEVHDVTFAGHSGQPIKGWLPPRNPEGSESYQEAAKVRFLAEIWR